MRAQLTLPGVVRGCALIVALGSALVLGQALLKEPTERRCEITDVAVPCSSRGMRLPGLSLQLAHSTYEVGRIAHSRPARAALLLANRRDYLAIPMYVALFVGLGLLLGRRRPTAGALVIACAVGAGVLDVVENIGITAELTTQALTPLMVKIVLWTASSKWLLLFAMAGALSALLLPREALLMKLVGVAFAGAAVIGVYGLTLKRPLVEAGFLLMLAALTGLGLSLLLAPQQLTADKEE